MRRIGLLPVLAVTLATALAAQVKPGLAVDHAVRGRGVVHYGKWVTAALAVTFTALGAHEHTNSNGVFRRLLDLCHANNADCTLAPDGSYLTPAAEQLYQASVRFDRRARLRLVLGQASLLASAGLFLADLGHHAGGPDNIPFHALKLSVDPRTGATLVGVRLRF
jgi:hypothetical protein